VPVPDRIRHEFGGDQCDGFVHGAVVGVPPLVQPERESLRARRAPRGVDVKRMANSRVEISDFMPLTLAHAQ
jgi:hypothetical protein